jgi:hypothetical protein
LTLQISNQKFQSNLHHNLQRNTNHIRDFRTITTTMRKKATEQRHIFLELFQILDHLTGQTTRLSAGRTDGQTRTDDQALAD